MTLRTSGPADIAYRHRIRGVRDMRYWDMRETGLEKTVCQIGELHLWKRA